MPLLLLKLNNIKYFYYYLYLIGMKPLFNNIVEMVKK
jgi:hypothetical protein